MDAFGRLELVGYGFCHIPTQPGSHEVDIPTWRPVGSPAEEFAAFYLGGVPRLVRSSYVYSKRTERHRLITTGSGLVHVRFDVIVRNFSTHGVEFG